MNSKHTQTGQLALEQALRQAVAALQSGRPQEAEWLAADVLKASPAEPRALQVFGYALLQQGKAKEAIAPLKSAARRARDPEIETQLAMAYQQAGNDNDAIEQLERAISRSPPFPPAFLVYGSLLTFLDQRDKALEIVKRGLAIAPNFPDLLSLLGDNLMMRGDAAGGRNAYNEALKYAPTHGDALFGLARALQNDGDFAGAAALFKRILTVQPSDNAARIGLGVCLLELGDSEAGYHELRHAAQRDAQAYAEVVNAVSMARTGRFWLRASQARRFLSDKNT